MKTIQLLSGVAFAALISVPGLAQAQTFPTSNPNAGEWALINLTTTTVAAANGGSGVTVGLFDGRTDCRDTDIAGRCLNFVYSGATYSRYDNHGTHTAGTIAGARYGEAPRASIVNYAVFSDTGYVAGGSGLINGWLGAASRGASIASMSFGCTRMALCFSASEVRAMASSNLAGTLFVKAAGNDGAILNNESIAVTAAEAQTALGRLLLVGSVNINGGISTFSNRPGDTCLRVTGQTACTSATQWKYRFIVAPGEAIYATLPNNTYGYMSGTSMATPIVAGAAALLEARWPALKSQPATVAAILLNSATDLGAPGVDPVYGRGLLNVGRAFQNAGTTTVVSPAGTSVTVSNTTTSNPPVFGKTAAVLGGVTAYDSYGRDYRIAELSNFRVRGSALQMFGVPDSPVVNMGRQSEWSAAFFAPAGETRAYAAFGPRGPAGQGGLSFDQSLRAGVDAPLGAGQVSLRLTGAGDARADLAADPALRPMSFFASSDLLNQSALASVNLPFAGSGRLTLFGASSLGGDIAPSPFAGQLVQPYLQNLDPQGALSLNRSPLRQSAVGIGYWMRPDARTVVGVTASAFTQRHGFYDLASDISTFDRPTRLYNLGLAASRAYGDWDVFGAAEVTALRAPRTDGPIRFTDGALVSGEVGVRRSSLFVRGARNDVAAVTLRAMPQAIAGRLQLDYLAPTEDGLAAQAVHSSTPLAEITGRTVRLDTSYALRQGDDWSVGLAGGADLSGGREYQLMARARAAY